MPEEARVLGFGAAFDTVVAQKSRNQIVSLTSHRGADSNPPHRHSNDYVCIVIAGKFAEQHHNSWREWRTGAYFAHEAGEIHHDRFGPSGAVCLNVHFPRGELPAASRQGVCSLPARLAADQLAFELTAGSNDELAIAALTAEIMGEVVSVRANPRDRGTWLDRLVEAISDEPRRRWSLGELAAVAGRHPVHVAQAFRAATGISLGAFQRLRRLVNLSLALRRGNGALAELACEFGYCDQSHMSTEVRAAFGISPGRYRREFH
jgi:AraC family transcriptional regulator